MNNILVGIYAYFFAGLVILAFCLVSGLPWEGFILQSNITQIAAGVVCAIFLRK